MDYTKILNNIKPTKKEKEKVTSFAKKLIKTINQITNQKNIKAEAILVGSIAKGTWLAGEADIDIFIKFPLDTPQEKLKKEGLQLGYECIKNLKGQPEERYASHPYVTGHIGEYEVDFVPCYDIKEASQLKSAVDRTILHTRYIKKHLKKEQIKEVLLLKKFMKAIKAYGSEFKVGGFAGYLCELLIIAYGNFQGVLEAASKWRKGQIIDIEGYGTGGNFEDPLIVVDPTDKKRNVASALTQQKLSEFIIAARNFLENPKIGYFKEIEYSRDKEEIQEKFKEREGECLILKFKSPRAPPDTLYPQLKKSMDTLVSHLSKEGFKVNRSSYWSDEKKNALIIFEFETWKLPRYKKHMGPTVWSRKHTKRFHKKYGDKIWIEGDRLFVEKKRKATKPDLYLKILLSERINQLGLGKHIKKELKKEYKILDINEYLETRQPPEALEFLDEFLNPGKHLWRS